METNFNTWSEFVAALSNGVLNLRDLMAEGVNPNLSTVDTLIGSLGTVLSAGQFFAEKLRYGAFCNKVTGAGLLANVAAFDVAVRQMNEAESGGQQALLVGNHGEVEIQRGKCLMVDQLAI